MSKIVRNAIKHVWPNGLSKPVKSTFRVYAQVEEGGLPVRQSQAQNLAKALNKAAKLAQALYWEVREFRNGVERLVQIEEVNL